LLQYKIAIYLVPVVEKKISAPAMPGSIFLMVSLDNPGGRQPLPVDFFL